MCLIAVGQRIQLHTIYVDRNWKVIFFGGGGGLRLILVRMCESVFWNQPQSYPRPLKKKPSLFIYLILQKIDLFIYCSLNFYTLSYPLWFVNKFTNDPLNENLLYVNVKTKAWRVSERKICLYTWVWENLSYSNFKNQAIHKKGRGVIIYLGALKKGAIRHAHPYYVMYRVPPPSEVLNHLWCRICWKEGISIKYPCT